MIEGLKPYPSYTETGLPWLGQIPATWKLRRAKYLFREVDERSRTGSEELLSVSHKTGVTPRSQKNVTMFMAESNVGHKVCRPDDLVINTLWAWMAALGVSRHHGMVSPAYGVYRPIDPSGFRPRFADQLLRTPFYAAEYQRCSTGVNSSRLRLYPEAFFRIPIMLPPPEEQDAIVRFLAHANQKIDGFIRAKRKLIGLLNEQKQAIIHQAVTRGLDPSVPLKPSGIPWLGDIPKHWEVMQLRQVLSFGPKNGVSPQAASGTGVLSFSISAVRGGRITIEGNEKAVELDSARIAGFRVHQGDILLVRGNGNGALVGKCGLVDACPENCVYPDILMKPRPNQKMNAEFMVSAINSSYVTNQVSTLAKTSNGAFKVSGATVPSLAIVVPPFAEQIEHLPEVISGKRCLRRFFWGRE